MHACALREYFFFKFKNVLFWTAIQFQGQRKDKYELGDVGGDPIVLEVQLAVAVERSGIVEEVRVDGGAHGVRDQALDLDAVHAASKQGLQLNRIVD